MTARIVEAVDMINASLVCMESILSTEKKLLAVLMDVYEASIIYLYCDGDTAY